MRASSRYFALALIVLYMPVVVEAQAPRSMSFQGYLTDTLGVPTDGLEDITLSLFPLAAGGGAIWTRTYALVPVTNGVFNVLLQDGTPSFARLPFTDST